MKPVDIYILDVICPKCKSINTYQYDTDECEFSYDGTGHYRPDYHCKDCNNNFRKTYYFKYEITEEFD